LAKIKNLRPSLEIVLLVNLTINIFVEYQDHCQNLEFGVNSKSKCWKLILIEYKNFGWNWNFRHKENKGNNFGQNSNFTI